MKNFFDDYGMITFGIVVNTGVLFVQVYYPSSAKWMQMSLTALQLSAVAILTYRFGWMKGYSHERRMKELFDRYQGGRGI